MIDNNSRYLWIDVTKALAIILMVIGHTSIPKVASDFIFAFHMPVFFLASGWCTNWNKYTFKEFFIHRCKSLLIPFFFYSLVVVVWSLLIGTPLFSWTDGWQGYALWFVPVLFISGLVAKLVMSISNKNYCLVATLGCLALGGWLSYYRVLMPWTLSTVPYATFLIITGSYLRGFSHIIEKPRWYFFVGGILLVALISHFWRLDLAWNVITPVIPLTIGALSGAAMLATFSSYLEKNAQLTTTTLKAIGLETFAIMAFSQITIITLNKFFTLNPIVKYFFLILILAFLIIIKNTIIGLIRRAYQ